MGTVTWIQAGDVEEREQRCCLAMLRKRPELNLVIVDGRTA